MRPPAPPPAAAAVPALPPPLSPSDLVVPGQQQQQRQQQAAAVGVGSGRSLLLPAPPPTVVYTVAGSPPWPGITAPPGLAYAPVGTMLNRVGTGSSTAPLPAAQFAVFGGGRAMQAIGPPLSHSPPLRGTGVPGMIASTLAAQAFAGSNAPGARMGSLHIKPLMGVPAPPAGAMAPQQRRAVSKGPPGPSYAETGGRNVKR